MALTDALDVEPRSQAKRRAVPSTLFAGGDQGGTNGKDLTYANPLRTVLDALKVDLAFD